MFRRPTFVTIFAIGLVVAEGLALAIRFKHLRYKVSIGTEQWNTEMKDFSHCFFSPLTL